MRKPRVVGHRILVQPKYVASMIKTEGGATIHIPETSRDAEQAGVSEGVVVELGPDAYKGDTFYSQWCDVGDVVVFPRYCGRHWPNDKEPTHYVLNDEDVLLRLEEVNE